MIPGSQKSTGGLQKVLTLSVLPNVLFVLWLVHLYFDRDSRWLHLVWGLGFWSCTFVFPRLGTILMLATAPWLEAPVLALGYRNQYLFEIGLLTWSHAWVCRDWLGFSDKRSFGFSGPSNTQGRLWAHPLAASLFFAGIVSLFSFASAVGEFKAFSPEHTHTMVVLKNIFADVFYWDVTAPTHRLHYAVGFLILFSGLARLNSAWSALGFDRARVAGIILVSGLFPVALAYFQFLWPDTWRWPFLSDIGGSFQNGNHLSFLGGFLLFVLGSWVTLTRRWVIGSMYGVGVAIPMLLLGLGRTAWLATIGGMILLSMLFGLRKIKAGRWSQAIAIFGTLTVLIVGLWFIVSHGQAIGSRCADRAICREISMLSELEVKFDWGSFGARGRAPINAVAFEFLGERPWRGIGAGSFFGVSQLQAEIHNHFIHWLVSFGVFGALVFLLGAGGFLFRWVVLGTSRDERFQRERLWAIGCIGYLVLASMGDVFFIFRDLCWVVAVWLLAQVISDESRDRANSGGADTVVFAAVSALALAVSVTFIWSPQSLSGIGTRTLTGLHWTDPLATSVPTGPALSFGSTHYPPGCARVLVKTPSNSGQQVIEFGLRGGMRTIAQRPLTFTQLKYSEKGKQYELFPGVWQAICACITESDEAAVELECHQVESCEYYINAPFGQYPIWDRRPASDAGINPRDFVSLQVKGFQELTREQMLTKPWVDGAQCGRIVEQRFR